jgi:signal peptidase II
MVLIVVLAVLSLDQLTKFFISRNLSLNESIPLLKGVFHITLIYNRGAAFGILKNQLALFVATAIIAIILIYFNLRQAKEIRMQSVALSLILAGAIGNLIDRLFLGHVVDFLDFRIWPVFNFADSAITVGAILLGYSILRSSNKRGQ